MNDKQEEYIKLFFKYLEEDDKRRKLQEELTKRKTLIENTATKELFDNLKFINSFGWKIKLIENEHFEIFSDDVTKPVKISLTLLNENEKTFWMTGHVGVSKIPNQTGYTLDKITEMLVSALAYNTNPWDIPTYANGIESSFRIKSTDKFD